MTLLSRFLFRKSKEKSRQNLYEMLTAALSDVPFDGRILNVGSGGGVADTIAKSTSSSVHIVSADIDPSRKPDIVLDICNSEFVDEFDVIVMSEVLEHIPTPHLALERVLMALKPGGKLILSTPFVFPIHDRPHDFFRYTKYGLQYLLRDYSSVAVLERNGWAEAIVVLMARVANTPFKQRSVRYGVGIFSVLIFPLARALSNYAPNDFITSGYFVTAFKHQANGIGAHP